LRTLQYSENPASPVTLIPDIHYTTPDNELKINISLYYQVVLKYDMIYYLFLGRGNSIGLRMYISESNKLIDLNITNNFPGVYHVWIIRPPTTNNYKIELYTEYPSLLSWSGFGIFELPVEEFGYGSIDSKNHFPNVHILDSVVFAHYKIESTNIRLNKSYGLDTPLKYLKVNTSESSFTEILPTSGKELPDTNFSLDKGDYIVWPSDQRPSMPRLQIVQEQEDQEQERAISGYPFWILGLISVLAILKLKKNLRLSCGTTPSLY